MKAPFGFMLGGVAIEVARWALGSALSEAYQVYGWRWAEVGAAMFEALKIAGYLAVAIGCMVALVLIGRELMRPGPLPAPSISKAPCATPSPPAAAPISPKQAHDKPGPVLRGTSSAYRKAVLQVTEVKSEREAASGGQIKSALCWMQVTNTILQPLQKCSVELVSLEREGKVQEINKTMSAGTFALVNGHGRRLALARRDRTDLVSNPPHLIRTVDEDFGFEDGSKYLVHLALHSEYAHPTFVTIELDVPEDPDGAVMGKVISQDVDRT
ncbi:hypothetical protein [Brevundimonas naejangsanensis]|uniref:hypothetical protein n=1 Tax=Brevundimonas naejangsanensis TaxID=588932 RepID=UPI0012DD2F6E|nr:hypothetical protein [Brevundimonas naejangsanensis]